MGSAAAENRFAADEFSFMDNAAAAQGSWSHPACFACCNLHAWKRCKKYRWGKVAMLAPTEQEMQKHLVEGLQCFCCHLPQLLTLLRHHHTLPPICLLCFVGWLCMRLHVANISPCERYASSKDRQFWAAAPRRTGDSVAATTRMTWHSTPHYLHLMSSPMRHSPWQSG